MPIDLDQFRRLKKTAEDARAESERAAGALEQLMGELKSEHGCGTVEDAERLLKKLERDVTKMEGEYEAALSEFEEKWRNEIYVWGTYRPGAQGHATGQP